MNEDWRKREYDGSYRYLEAVGVMFWEQTDCRYKRAGNLLYRGQAMTWAMGRRTHFDNKWSEAPHTYPMCSMCTVRSMDSELYIVSLTYSD
jgi:hypothetical protein